VPMLVALALLDHVDDLVHSLEMSDLWMGLLRPRLPHVEAMMFGPGERKRICKRVSDLRLHNRRTLQRLFGLDSKMRRRRPIRRPRREGGDR
jgi:hypothetical protein